jgi:hypothetical protein
MIKEVSLVFITPIWANESKERNKKGRNLFIQSSPHNLDELKSGKVSLPQKSPLPFRKFQKEPVPLKGNLKTNSFGGGKSVALPYP